MLMTSLKNSVHLFLSREQELIQISKKLIHFDLKEGQEGQRFF
jgi:hypothetical protein